MGAAAEAAIAWQAIQLGVPVLRPLFIDCRYDLVFELPTGLARIQCKWAPRQGGVVLIRGRTCRRTADGYERGTYSSDEIDAIAAYCRDTDRCYLVPIKDMPAS